MACKCYHAERNFLGKIGVCWGTKECEACLCGGEESKCDFYEDKREKATLKITNGDYMPRWIPVTETPPRKVGDDGYNGYLVYANGYYKVSDYTTDKFDNVPYFHVDGEYEPDVTHYMPLPEPPKEEGE